MMPSLFQLASAIVRTWTRAYTVGLPPGLRETRRAEIDSDVWEFQHDSEVNQRLSPAMHVLARLLIGIPHDLCWRLGHHAVEGARGVQGMSVWRLARPPHVTFTAFACSLTLHAFAGIGIIWLASFPMEHPSAIQTRYMNRAARPSFNPAAASVGIPTEAGEGVAMLVNRHSGEMPTTWTRLLAGIAVAAGPVIVGVLPSTLVSAQSGADAGAPAFEVASVRPNKVADAPKFVSMPPGRFTATSLTLRELAAIAYRIPRSLLNYQIVGGPAWIDSDRFDVVAVANGQPPPAQILLMLRALLNERFQMRARTETRQLSVYALLMARGDRRVGPQLQASSVDCPSLTAAERFPAKGPPVCGIRFSPGRLAAGAVTMAELVTTGFSRVIADRVVLDRTDLSGAFDLNLEWTPVPGPGEFVPPPPPPGVPPLPPAMVDGPSLFTAVQEQLGLKLESTKGPVDVLVIDHAEQPTPD